MKDNQEIGVGPIDMSSQDPHVTIDCLLCGRQYMKKVEFGKTFFTPCCAMEYRLSPLPNGSVEVEVKLTKEQMDRLS